MPLGTLDRSPPPFFRQGPSALSKLVFFSALALFLMVADARLGVTGPLRAAAAVVLYPLQWVTLQPVRAVREGVGYFQSLSEARRNEDLARIQLTRQSQQANQSEFLLQENARLRELLNLRARLTTPSQAAQVLYDAADPYTRKVVIDRGMTHGVQAGSPVIDESGVLGQVTRVHALVSEVTLLVDRDQPTPVLNVRTGARGVVYGDPSSHGGSLELRFMDGNADVKAGDVLSTSGVDGVYPPGLPVARVDRVERRADSAFARIHCVPMAQVNGALHVMVLGPINAQLPQRPEPPATAPAVRKGSRK